MNVTIMRKARQGAAALALLGLMGQGAWAQTLHVLRPVKGAIVRETVPVKIAVGDLPTEGYIGVTIDGKFRTARVLPQVKGDPVYEWDTKAPYTTSDDPNTQLFVADGDHTLTIKLYDSSGKTLGEATIPLRVANKISPPSQGVKLSYQWKTNLQQRYVRTSELDVVGSDTTTPDQILQASSVHFTRSVEDTTGGGFLVRDRVLPGGILSLSGQTTPVESAFIIRSKYRTMDTRGDVLSTMSPLSAGDHLGFSIPVLSARRVAIGDTWQAPAEVMVTALTPMPAPVMTESRLEGFEWQDGYPSAKIRETYTGPLTFTVPAGSQTGAGSSVTIQSAKYERVVYFAYNSGRLVRTETTLTFASDSPILGSAAPAPAAVSAPASAFDPSAENIPPPDSPGAQPQPYSTGQPAVPPSALTNYKMTETTSPG